MIYIVYQTKNSVNGKIYVGVHKTDDPNDDYLGSGIILQQAIAKHGRDNFTRTTLNEFDNSTDAFAYEATIVTEEFVSREDTYNVKLGGCGGWDYVNGNMTDEQIQRRVKNYKRTMTDERYAKRSAKARRTWKMKDRKDHKQRVRQGVARRDEASRIENFKQTMASRDPKLEDIRKQKISDAGAKTWELTSPLGEVFVIKSLRKFCMEHNLNMHAMYNSAAGHEQFKNPGWKCRRL